MEAAWTKINTEKFKFNLMFITLRTEEVWFIKAIII